MAAMADRLRLRHLIEERLKGSRPPCDPAAALPAGFASPVGPAIRHHFPAAPVPAAVLIPLVDREEGLTVLLTRRASHLKNHAGQISFPGGRIESTDAGPLAAALRETEEEIGLSRQHVTFAGFLEAQLVLSGFWVTPVVGFVHPDFSLQIDQREVAATFEVPLTHVLDSTNHHSRERTLGELAVRVHDIHYREHRIWGATAGMLMTLYKLLIDPK